MLCTDIPKKLFSSSLGKPFTHIVMIEYVNKVSTCPCSFQVMMYMLIADQTDTAAHSSDYSLDDS